jgi:hypothetical protein
MKTKIFTYLLIAGCALIIMASKISQDERFYYAFDEKVALIIKPNTLFVEHVKGIEKENAEKSLADMVPDAEIKWHSSILAEIVCNSEKSKKELSLKLIQKDEVKFCFPIYVTKEVLVRELLMKF